MSNHSAKISTSEVVQLDTGFDRQGREEGRTRSCSWFTVEDVRRFLGEDGRTQLVSGHSLRLGKISLLLHLPIWEKKEKQKGTIHFFQI